MCICRRRRKQGGGNDQRERNQKKGRHKNVSPTSGCLLKMDDHGTGGGRPRNVGINGNRRKGFLVAARGRFWDGGRFNWLVDAACRRWNAFSFNINYHFPPILLFPFAKKTAGDPE